MAGETQQQEESVSLKAMGAEANYKGHNLASFFRFLITVGIVVLVLLGLQEKQESSKEHAELKATLNQHTEAQQETTYVLTLSQFEKDKLNLVMPDSLRRKIRP